MRARGDTLAEIARRKGIHLAKVHRLLADERDNPGKVTLWDIGSGVELRTFFVTRGEVHLHRQRYRGRRFRWWAVHRTTAKCDTLECLRMRLG